MAPVAMVACTNVDGAESVVPWSRALGTSTPHARIVTDPVLPWDLAAMERHVAGLLAVDAIHRAEVARVRLDALPVARYTSRVHVEPAPLRQVGVAGDLEAALASIADAPRWVDPSVALVRVRKVIETKGTTRTQMIAALDWVEA